MIVFSDILLKHVGFNTMAPNTLILKEEPSLSNNIPDIVKYEEQTSNNRIFQLDRMNIL